MAGSATFLWASFRVQSGCEARIGPVIYGVIRYQLRLGASKTAYRSNELQASCILIERFLFDTCLQLLKVWRIPPSIKIRIQSSALTDPLMPLSQIHLTVSHLPSSCSFFLSSLSPLGYRCLGQRGKDIAFGINSVEFYLHQQTPG